MIPTVSYAQYLQAMATSHASSNTTDPASMTGIAALVVQARNRIACEGIRSVAKGMLLAHKHTMAGLASCGRVPERIPFFVGDFSAVDPGFMLDFTGAFSKLTIEGESPAADYVAFNERNLEVSNFAGASWEDILPLSHSFRKWLRKRLGSAPTVIVPKHGPGSTAEYVSQSDKWWYCDRPLSHTSDVSRMTDVPKDFAKRRLIAIEPVQRQYIQQGLARALRATRFFRSWVCLDAVDGPRHLGLACRPGMTTVDLSDASDRIPVSLVEYLLPGDWFSVLCEHTAIRASQPDGSVHNLGMFATMGCGYCFEVQSLIFRLLCILVGHQRTGLSFSTCATRCHAFGDDIIVPESWLPEVLGLFDLLGFQWNPRKTCHSPDLFKETVGWWITKGLARRRFTPELYGDTKSISLPLLGTELFALSERAACAGYGDLQKLLLAGRKVHYRFNSELQRCEIRVLDEVARTRENSLTGALKLRAWFFGAPVPDHEEMPGETRLSWSWVPLWDFPNLAALLPPYDHSDIQSVKDTTGVFTL